MSTLHNNTITAIACRTLYEIAPGAPVRWVPRVGGQIRVRTGRIWLTREGDARDYWLEAGTAMPVVAGDVFWASVEGEVPGHLEMRSSAPPAHIWRAWRHVRGLLPGASRAAGVAGAALR